MSIKKIGLLHFLATTCGNGQREMENPAGMDKISRIFPGVG